MPYREACQRIAREMKEEFAIKAAWGPKPSDGSVDPAVRRLRTVDRQTALVSGKSLWGKVKGRKR